MISGTGNIPTEHVSTVADLTKQLFNLQIQLIVQSQLIVENLLEI